MTRRGSSAVGDRRSRVAVGGSEVPLPAVVVVVVVAVVVVAGMLVAGVGVAGGWDAT
jgi:hypothetical protein